MTYYEVYSTKYMILRDKMKKLLTTLAVGTILAGNAFGADCDSKISNVDQTAPLDSVRVDTELLDDPCCGAFSVARRYFVDNDIMGNWLEDRPDLKFQWAGNDQWYTLELDDKYNVAGTDTVFAEPDTVFAEPDTYDIDLNFIIINSNSDSLTSIVGELERDNSSLRTNNFELQNELIENAGSRFLPNRANIFGSKNYLGAGLDWYLDNNVVVGLNFFKDFESETNAYKEISEEGSVQGMPYDRYAICDSTTVTENGSHTLALKFGYNLDEDVNFTPYILAGVGFRNVDNGETTFTELYDNNTLVGRYPSTEEKHTENRFSEVYGVGCDVIFDNGFSAGAYLMGDDGKYSVGASLGWGSK